MQKTRERTASADSNAGSPDKRPELDAVFDAAINYAFQQNAIPVVKELRFRNDSTARKNVVLRVSTEPAFATMAEIHIQSIEAGGEFRVAPLDLKLSHDFLAGLNEKVVGWLKIEAFEKGDGTMADAGVVAGATPTEVEERAGETPALHTEAGENCGVGAGGADCGNTGAPPAPLSAPAAAPATATTPRLLCSRVESVALLARNEWCGLAGLPEILAAFILPNDPAVMPILCRASDLLRDATGRGALNGYQDKSRERAWKQVAAIYRAVAELGVRYINPPASFERNGQKISFPSQIVAERFGTCLDLALLFAACCERAGLHPLVLSHEGHAYAGCWLEERALPDAAADGADALQQVRKLETEELVTVFETTLVASETPGTLSDAERAARPHLQTEKPFHLALDVVRARAARILPLPVPGQTPAGADGATGAENVPEGIGERDFSDSPETPAAAAAARPATRIDQWKSRLLDLSLRNRFLSFRETKSTIRILSAEPARVEDELAAEKELRLRPKPRLLGDDDPRHAATLTARQRDDALAAHLADELKDGRLHTHLDDAEHARRLTDLFRAARNALDENGTNTLFAAVGILEWRETEHSDRVHRAPLLLVPVVLKRKSVLEGFALRRVDEETRLNVTLMEMLRQQFQKEIAGLDPLPEDDNGVNVARVFQIFRDAVRDLAGWEVREEIWLAQFSFTKFLLWKDLADRLDALARNRVVHHLVHAAGTPYDNPPDDITPPRLDDRFHPRDVFCPRSADSSQLAAVMAAAAGHDFVLEGPPGTGKSQTITNIIAHCLAHGKRVLFVAEKRAALDVVHRRLCEEGLEPFCLELHSNKIGKADVLAQFDKSLKFAAAGSAPDWEARAAEMERLRAALNAYARTLHRAAPCGLSAHDCFDHLLPRRAAPTVRLDNWPNLLETTAAALDAARLLSRQLQERARAVMPLRDHPLAPLACEEWTPSWAERALERGCELAAKTRAAAAALEDLRTWMRCPDEGVPRALLLSLRALAASLLAPEPVGPAFATTPWNPLGANLERWGGLARERASLRARLAGYDEARLLALDLDSLKARWSAAQSSWFLAKWLRLGGIRKILRAARPDQSKPPAAGLGEILGGALRLRAINAALRADEIAAQSTLGALWEKGEPDAGAIDRVRAWGESLHASIVACARGDFAWLGQIRQLLAALFAEGTSAYAPGTIAGTRLARHRDAVDALETALENFAASASLRREFADAAPDFLAALGAFTARLPEAWKRIREWCLWQRTRREARECGLAPIVEKLEADGGAALDVPALFENGFRKALLFALIEREPALREFFGREQNERIERFRELDEKLAALSREIIRARLAARIPREQNPDDIPKAEIGLLRRELGKRMRHIPVRKLLSGIPKLLPRLKPCVLMSPLSVAQYLEASHETFDVVIFDEASQIPVWDAVGAIARGRQLIVVGDPKQLPPTSFFNSGASDDEDDDEPEVHKDLESVLDELLSHQMRHKRLQWHYRSRHEGLIAFSNRQYYDNDLLTFPSPDSTQGGVRLHHLPDARYGKGKTRTNPDEAAALVAALVARLRDPAAPKRSYGVVTFSLAQQQLIENLLDDERRKHPEIEPHFGDDPPVVGEPVFVKNLENVQGDERDVILFSICYGPDETGKVAMNFGPLNRDGGERRLNVAITRAKHEIAVFSGLSDDQIDLNRTRARGVRDLKYFLQYAKNGPRALAASPSRNASDGNGGGGGAGGVGGVGGGASFAAVSAAGTASGGAVGVVGVAAAHGSASDGAAAPAAAVGAHAAAPVPVVIAVGAPQPDSEFVGMVAARLRESGYEVHTQVGCSGYRIDLAVVDPAAPGRYLLGIECDGATYRRAATARDRDKLRQLVLESLGWRLHRLWSTDWWHNPDTELQGILSRLSHLHPVPPSAAVTTT